jgi:hypothetical protein
LRLLGNHVLDKIPFVVAFGEPSNLNSERLPSVSGSVPIYAMYDGKNIDMSWASACHLNDGHVCRLKEHIHQLCALANPCHDNWDHGKAIRGMLSNSNMAHYDIFVKVPRIRPDTLRHVFERCCPPSLEDDRVVSKLPGFALANYILQELHTKFPQFTWFEGHALGGVARDSMKNVQKQGQLIVADDRSETLLLGKHWDPQLGSSGASSSLLIGGFLASPGKVTDEDLEQVRAQIHRDYGSLIGDIIVGNDNPLIPN